MTVVGKILVFLNLVFSLFVGGLAIVDYSARTNWVEANRDLKKQYDTLSTTAVAFKAEADRLTKEKTDLYEKLRAENIVIDPTGKDDKDSGFRVATNALIALKDRNKTIDELKVQIDTLRKQLAEEKGKNVNLLALERAYKTDAERRQTDTKMLRDTLKVEMDKNFKLEQEKNILRDDMVLAKIEAKTMKDRNSQLETQLQDLARSLAKAKSSLGSGAGVARGVNPPAENIEGQVTRADGNLVSISVGSDNGLSRDQTMEVFRLGQNPRYIGRIRLIEVTATKSVGQIVGRATLPIQAGDKVASRIMGGY